MARLLVVDDDLAVLQLVVGVLVALGHRIQAAKDGAEAREILDREPVDVLITDLQMPRMDGFAPLTHVRSASPQVPVIVVSGSRTPNHRQQARDFGAALVYAKPTDLGQLARDVEELVEHP